MVAADKRSFVIMALETKHRLLLRRSLELCNKFHGHGEVGLQHKHKSHTKQIIAIGISSVKNAHATLNMPRDLLYESLFWLTSEQGKLAIGMYQEGHVVA